LKLEKIDILDNFNSVLIYEKDIIIFLNLNLVHLDDDESLLYFFDMSYTIATINFKTQKI
jgi:hypothetical protein